MHDETLMSLSIADYLIAGDSLLVLVVLPEHVAQPSPSRRIAVVNPQSFAVALLGCLTPYLALCPPQVPQIIVHIDLPITQSMTSVQGCCAHQRDVVHIKVFV